jgi:AcrR family transcriptional regulator
MVDAAVRLFAEKGYGSTSVQDVADAIGVLKGSLYHYIDSKEDLLFQIFYQAHRENDELIKEISELDLDAVAKLRVYIERTLQTTIANLDRTSLYFRDWRNLTGERLETLIQERRSYDRFLRDL